MSIAPPLDTFATTQLSRALANDVAAHFLQRPRDPSTAFEVLNALAVVCAHVIRGTGHHAESMRSWLDVAIDINVMGEEQGHG